MKRVYRQCRSVCLCLGLLAWSGMLSPLLAQNLQVTSASPDTTPQGTISLDVTIGGSGFKKGAKAAWFLSGTTNPAGVTVNSTAFVSSTQLTANITVSDTATIGSFDVVVYSSGRTGKGTGLFSVTEKGSSSGCTTLGTPGNFTLATTLNYVNSSGTAQYQTKLGLNVTVRPVTVTDGVQSKEIIVAAVGTGNGNGKLEIFFLDPANGQVLDGQSLFSGGPVQPHYTIVTNPNLTGAVGAVGGDLNGDAIPDFVVARNDSNDLAILVGHMDGAGILTYGSPIIFNPSPTSPLFYGDNGKAIGDLDGENGDELAVGVFGGKNRGKTTYGAVNIYKLSGSDVVLIHTVNDPLLDASDTFGGPMAIGDVTGDGAPDLVAAAHNTTVGGAAEAGMIFVFPAPLTSSSSFRLTGGTTGDHIGYQVGLGILTNSTATDVVATTSWPGATSTSTTNPRALIYSGPITSNRTASSFDFVPYPDLDEGWASRLDIGDMTGDGRVEVLVGAPIATNSTSCTTGAGAAHLYLSNPSNPGQPALTVFQPPDLDTGYGGFGFGIAVVPYSLGNPTLLLVGERSREVGGVAGAGQVYVYKQN